MSDSEARRVRGRVKNLLTKKYAIEILEESHRVVSKAPLTESVANYVRVELLRRKIGDNQRELKVAELGVLAQLLLLDVAEEIHDLPDFGLKSLSWCIDEDLAARHVLLDVVRDQEIGLFMAKSLLITSIDLFPNPPFHIKELRKWYGPSKPTGRPKSNDSVRALVEAGILQKYAILAATEIRTEGLRPVKNRVAYRLNKGLLKDFNFDQDYIIRHLRAEWWSNK